MITYYKEGITFIGIAVTPAVYKREGNKMSFTSFSFLFVFFPLCIAGYLIVWFIQKKLNKDSLMLCNLFLVLAGFGFYGWALVDGALYLGIYIIFVYIIGRCLERGQGDKNRSKRTAIAGVAVLILTGILYYYKYYNFTIETMNRGFSSQFDTLELIIPLGISFVTFSAISYVVDIYRGNVPAGSLLDTALYLTFFPKVVSGPIVLWKDFQTQAKSRSLDDSRFIEGLNRIMIGYAKKVILADTFGAVINDMQYKMYTGMDVPTAWLCALLYMLQIYYDFSGYSDIALGLAGLFGFNLKENFHFPYVSSSISEFWRRWHISLGTWFREYIYIPLGGNRRGKYRTLMNLFIVFLVTGIWHGAGWNYIYWGILNGICMIVERCIRNKKFYVKIPYVIKWAITMFIVLISWQIFRMDAIQDGFDFLKIMFGIASFEVVNFSFVYYFTPKMILLVTIAILGATFLHKGWFQNVYLKVNSSKALFVIQELVLFALMILAVIFMVNSTYSPFIYFQY